MLVVVLGVVEGTLAGVLAGVVAAELVLGRRCRWSCWRCRTRTTRARQVRRRRWLSFRECSAFRRSDPSRRLAEELADRVRVVRYRQQLQGVGEILPLARTVDCSQSINGSQ